MKKPALLVLGILFVAFVSIYFIIPQYITATSSVSIDTSDANVFKFLVKKEAWPKWWPGHHNPKDSNSFAFNGMMYTIKKDANSYVEVNVNTTKVEFDSRINYLANDEGSTAVSWEGSKQSSLNPFVRIMEFVRMKGEQTEMDSILRAFKAFMQQDSNVYGMRINVAHVKNGVMLATNVVTKTTPNVNEVYALVADLRKQISAQNATETNKPMLNVNKTDDNEYHVMVAIPVNKEIKPGPNSVINRMVVGGNILESEIKGGRGNIDNGFVQLKNFQKAHGLTSPAMPFELMVTDRSAEPDTAKWVTKIYWPVF